MESLQDMDNIFGLMDVFSKEISWMVFEKEREYGEEVLEIVIVIKEDIEMIKNGDMECSHGQAVMFIKEIMS